MSGSNSAVPSRRRRLAAVAMLTLAVVATAATSYTGPPPIRSSMPGGTIELDGDHPLVGQRFVVTIPAATAAGYPRSSVSVVLDGVAAFRPDGKSVSEADALAVRVVAVDPAASNGRSPLPGGRYNDVTEWPANLHSRATVDVPFDCARNAPCDRAFRLIATLRGGAATRGVIAWHIETSLSYNNGPFPSAAAMLVRVDDPVTAPGPPPELDVSLPSERIVLSAQRPAVVRLVQLRLAAADIGPDRPPRTSLEVYPAVVRSDLTSAAPVVTVQSVVNPTDTAPGIRGLLGAAGQHLTRDADVFADCVEGADCVRTVLIGISWARGPEIELDWQLTVHRLEFERAYAAPRDAIQVRLLDGLDASGPPSKLHLEGVTKYAPPKPGASPAPVPATIFVTARIVGGAPAYAALLPIPASAKLHLVLDRQLNQQPAYVRLKPGPNYADPGALETGSEALDPIANPFLSCTLGSQCPTWEMSTVLTGDPNAPPPDRVRWSLDLEIYSYPGLGIRAEATVNP